MSERQVNLGEQRAGSMERAASPISVIGLDTGLVIVASQDKAVFLQPDGQSETVQSKSQNTGGQSG